MRILQIIRSSMPPGGQSGAVHGLSHALALRGHQVTLLALHPRPRERLSLLATEPHAYRPVLLRLPRTRGWLHDTIFSWTIRRMVARGAFDLVHAHMLHPEGACALQALARCPVPLVVTGHGEDIQLDPACGYGVRRDPAVDRRVRAVLAGADHLIAIGEAMKAEMLAAGARSDRVAVIRWGCHPPAPASEAGLAPGYLLSVGRFVPKKGYDLLLHAMRHVLQARPSERLLIAGEGPELDALRALSVELGVDEAVRFLGFVTGGAKTALYRDARLFVCPSRWEPLGLVNLEAMASGLPVVAFRVDGIPEVVEDGVTGLLATPTDAAHLAGSILRLLEDPGLHRRMSGAARAAAGDHRWDDVAHRHEQLYRDVILRSRGVRAA